ncbi:MAG: helix-turn-helix domain-containing protein [Syntrophorhabdales bacterium]|jgi:DNA-binding MarR family transcriptional regulator
MGSENKILRYLKRRKIASGREICGAFGFSRQNLHKLVRKLIWRGAVVKEGKTKGAIYKVAEKLKNLHHHEDASYLKR